VPRYLPAIPHHLRVHDWSRFREGVVVREEPDDERELEQSNGGGGGDDTAVQHATTTAAAAKRKPGKSSLVDVGLLGERVRLDRAVKLGVRVTGRRVAATTVRRRPAAAAARSVSTAVPRERRDGRRLLSGKVVSPAKSRECGKYWGYAIRIAEDVEEVFAKSPHRGGGGRVRCGCRGGWRRRWCRANESSARVLPMRRPRRSDGVLVVPAREVL
jgi:predicted SPOUT superfamily RNA methylase MTH1